MTAQEQYLTLYKTYEGLLRESGSDPRQVETDLETGNPQQAARLRMCRLFRNYMAHENDPGFLVATDKMLEFLGGQVFELKIRNDSVKQHTKPAGNYIFEDTAKCADVLAKMVSGKIQTVIRHGKAGYDLCRWTDVVAMYMSSKASKLSVVKSARGKIVFAAPMDRFAELDPGKTTVCTADGTPEGKVIGVVKFE